MLRASSGILKQRHDSKYESASFCVHILYLIYVKELSLLVFSSSPYEELFIRRNSLLRILHRYLYFFNFNSRILRSAQINNASLKPAYPGSPTCCTCGYIFLFSLYISVHFHIMNIVLHMMYMIVNVHVMISFFSIISSLLSTTLSWRSYCTWS